jgi:hypothetical protein
MPRLPLSRRVVCPFCAAAVGAFCVNADGEPFTKGGSHGARTALASQTTAPEMAWLLSTCSATAPGLAWRLDGSAVVAERGNSEIRVTLSRITVGGVTTKTRRAWLGSTLTRVLKESV